MAATFLASMRAIFCAYRGFLRTARNAAVSRAKSEVAELKKQRREKKLEKESKVDYMTGDGDVIETKSQV